MNKFHELRLLALIHLYIIAIVENIKYDIRTNSKDEMIEIFQFYYKKYDYIKKFYDDGIILSVMSIKFHYYYVFLKNETGINATLVKAVYKEHIQNFEPEIKLSTNDLKKILFNLNMLNDYTHELYDMIKILFNKHSDIINLYEFNN